MFWLFVFGVAAIAAVLGGDQDGKKPPGGLAPKPSPEPQPPVPPTGNGNGNGMGLAAGAKVPSWYVLHAEDLDKKSAGTANDPDMSIPHTHKSIGKPTVQRMFNDPNNTPKAISSTVGWWSEAPNNPQNADPFPQHYHMLDLTKEQSAALLMGLPVEVYTRSGYNWDKVGGKSVFAEYPHYHRVRLQFRKPS